MLGKLLSGSIFIAICNTLTDIAVVEIYLVITGLKCKHTIRSVISGHRLQINHKIRMYGSIYPIVPGDIGKITSTVDPNFIPGMTYFITIGINAGSCYGTGTDTDSIQKVLICLGITIASGLTIYQRRIGAVMIAVKAVGNMVN